MEDFFWVGGWMEKVKIGTHSVHVPDDIWRSGSGIVLDCLEIGLLWYHIVLFALLGTKL